VLPEEPSEVALPILMSGTASGYEEDQQSYRRDKDDAVFLRRPLTVE
jgi:hypothetical protein